MVYVLKNGKVLSYQLKQDYYVTEWILVIVMTQVH